MALNKSNASFHEMLLLQWSALGALALPFGYSVSCGIQQVSQLERSSYLTSGSKTRLQTANSVAAPLSKDAPPPSFWRMTRQMFRDQKLVFKEEGRIRHTTIWRTLFLIPDARIRERLALNIVGLKALYRGIGTTCAVSPSCFHILSALNVSLTFDASA